MTGDDALSGPHAYLGRCCCGAPDHICQQVERAVAAERARIRSKPVVWDNAPLYEAICTGWSRYRGDDFEVQDAVNAVKALILEAIEGDGR